MPPRDDLVRHLRAADEHLSAVAPGAHIEARIRARLRGQPPSSRGPFGGLPLRRPLVLAFAVAALALILFAGRLRRADTLDAIASGPSAAPSAMPERIRADGGPPDLLLEPRPARPPRPIHAPALEEIPARRDKEPPRVPPFAAPPSAPRDTRPPETPSLDPGSSGPEPPIEPRDEGKKAARADRDLAEASLSPVVLGPPPASTSPNNPRPWSFHDTPTHSSPSDEPSGDDPNAGCKSTDELSAEAAATCKHKGLVLGELTYVGPCGDGRFRGFDARCMKESKPDPEPQACIGGDFGDGLTCQDYAAFPPKEQLIDFCTQAGLTLEEISITTDGCPSGTWSKATYKCCPLPPPAPPGDCSGGELGDGLTCQDYVVLKQQSVDLCQKTGGTLVDLESDGAGCPDGQWSHASYKCCGPGPEADPCKYDKLGDGKTCQDASALTQEASDTCAAAGLYAQATKLAYDCAGGQSTWAEIACCPVPAKP